MEKYSLTVNKEDAQRILYGLAQLPYIDVHSTIDKIHSQLVSQEKEGDKDEKT